MAEPTPRSFPREWAREKARLAKKKVPGTRLPAPVSGNPADRRGGVGGKVTNAAVARDLSAMVKAPRDLGLISAPPMTSRGQVPGTRVTPPASANPASRVGGVGGKQTGRANAISRGGRVASVTKAFSLPKPKKVMPAGSKGRTPRPRAM